LIYGTLETSLDVKGRGLDTPGLRKNLTGGATLALRNGKLTSFGFLKQLAQVLEAAGGRGIGKDETPFDSLTGTFEIANGRAATKDLRLDSADLDINGRGSIGLDQSIGMDVGVVLSEAVSADMVAKTAKLKSLVNRKGELALDLKAGGTLQKPSISVDPKMLKRASVRQMCLECHSSINDSFAPDVPSFHNQATVRYQNCTICHVAIHGSNTSNRFFR
jgi:uncharacterized protein involved in outer membrane biogenesis